MIDAHEQLEDAESRLKEIYGILHDLRVIIYELPPRDDTPRDIMLSRCVDAMRLAETDEEADEE